MTQRIRIAPVSVSLEGADRALVLAQLTQKQRAAVLLKAAQDRSGATFKQLTAGLSDENLSALLLGPAFVNADTSDMDYFLESLGINVTDDNIRQVVDLFKAWYKIVASDEYHEPRKLESMREVWQMPSL